MKRVTVLVMLLACVSAALAVEAATYRLLSASNTGKMILISSIPQKTKYMLDAATAKVTVDGKPAEFSSLQLYSVVHVKFDAKKGTKNGVDIDGVATEIRVLTPENPKVSSIP